MRPDLASRLRLYLVADPDYVHGDLLSTVGHALNGGVTAVQLRYKHGTDRAAMELARTLRSITVDHGALFLVNDRLDLALASGADGIHLGVDDLPLEDARRIGGPDLIIGYSPETDEQTQDAAERGANYLGVGPIFGTATKSDAGLAIGLETLNRRSELAGVPVVGIGGIRAQNARSVIDAGAIGVAVVSAISMQENPKAAAVALRRALDQ
ncbi:MAG TPA: thiamine phosphate synthase [Thermomicrobiales bacterium]|nr:thiamine phosphate synthase [Thermomicrobiales bacterium]